MTYPLHVRRMYRAANGGATRSWLAIAVKTAFDGVMSDTTLEERIAHLLRTVDDLSDVVARQDQDITLLKRRVGMLMKREVEREQAEGSVTLGNERPPHY